jgi:hypothetical protein
MDEAHRKLRRKLAKPCKGGIQHQRGGADRQGDYYWKEILKNAPT